MCHQPKESELDLSTLEELPLLEIREYLKKMGSSFETLKGFPKTDERPSKGFKYLTPNDMSRLCSYISIYCRNIKSIYCLSGEIKSDWQLNFLENMKAITKLELDHSCIDDTVLAMTKLPKLEILMLQNNYKISGKHLPEINNLKVLDLSVCTKIQSTHLIEFFKSQKELQKLDIRYCSRYTDTGLSADVYEAMVKYCDKLEVLKICCDNKRIQYECVARLSSLKLLTIQCVTKLRPEVLSALAEHKANQLEGLAINAYHSNAFGCAIPQLARLQNLKQLVWDNDFNLTDACLSPFGELVNLERIGLRDCGEITDEGLLGVLHCWTKLKHASVEGCAQITEKFVIGAIEVFSSRQQQLEEPVLLHITRTGIDESILKDSRYLAASSLLHLVFGDISDDPLKYR